MKIQAFANSIEREFDPDQYPVNAGYGDVQGRLITDGVLLLVDERKKR